MIVHHSGQIVTCQMNMIKTIGVRGQIFHSKFKGGKGESDDQLLSCAAFRSGGTRTEPASESSWSPLPTVDWVSVLRWAQNPDRLIQLK